MNKDLHSYRDSYLKNELLIENAHDDPFIQFSNWFEEADKQETIREANAMSLSTLGIDGFPKSRIVLLKAYSQKGFIFYTNYKSEKGNSIEAHPKVGLSFFWPSLERQIIIKGSIVKLPSEKSDVYFASRPKSSQLGAIVSYQSEITTREQLESRMKELSEKFQSKPIKRPEHWGGYIVSPVTIEFWQGRPSRLHDRILYVLEQANWTKKRLSP